MANEATLFAAAECRQDPRASRATDCIVPAARRQATQMVAAARASASRKRSVGCVGGKKGWGRVRCSQGPFARRDGRAGGSAERLPSYDVGASLDQCDCAALFTSTDMRRHLIARGRAYDIEACTSIIDRPAAARSAQPIAHSSLSKRKRTSEAPQHRAQTGVHTASAQFAVGRRRQGRCRRSWSRLCPTRCTLTRRTLRVPGWQGPTLRCVAEPFSSGDAHE